MGDHGLQLEILVLMKESRRDRTREMITRGKGKVDQVYRDYLFFFF